MATTAHDLLMNADLFKRVYPTWPHGGPAPEYVSPAVTAPVLDEAGDAARCEDCAHLPGCFCPHDCSPRGI
jgi:hypothetical protein